MANRLEALGMYLVQQSGKNFNFKLIRSNSIYPNILFSFGNDDYLVCENESELNSTIEIMEFRFATKDYPPKLVRKYTHKKFEKIHKKKKEHFLNKGIKYTIIKL